jgi:hypothetical protein
MDLLALKAEIEANPACSQAVIERDTKAIASVISAGRTRPGKTTIADVQAYLQSHGLWWSIKAAASDPAHAANAAAVATIDVASARYENVDMTIPFVGQMLSGLVAAAIITQADMDAIVAMGSESDPVSAQQVADALYTPET